MKSDIISVRMKRDDMPMVRKAARRAGLSVSSYIRSCTMEDFRTTAKEGGKIPEAMIRLWEMMDKKMGAGLQPVPPIPGATSTPPSNPNRAGRKARERGTS